MRRILVFAITLFICTGLNYAKKPDVDLSFLKKQNQLNCIIDFSNVTLNNTAPEGDFYHDVFVAQFEEWKKKLNEDEMYYQKRFFSGVINEFESRRMAFGNIPSAEYTVRVLIDKTTANGDIDATFVFSHTATEEEICKFQLHGGGGKFGSMMNLVGDGMRELGENFGKLLRKKSK